MKVNYAHVRRYLAMKFINTLLVIIAKKLQALSAPICNFLLDS